MFDLVADVEAYPDFLPFCEHLEVMDRSSEPGCDIITARMGVGYKMFRETFVSRARLNKGDLVIDIDYIEGPASHLVNRWTFVDIAEGGSEIDFYLEYKFRNPGLQLLMGTMIDKVFGRFAESFEARADKIYGG